MMTKYVLLQWSHSILCMRDGVPTPLKTPEHHPAATTDRSLLHHALECLHCNHRAPPHHDHPQLCLCPLVNCCVQYNICERIIPPEHTGNVAASVHPDGQAFVHEPLELGREHLDHTRCVDALMYVCPVVVFLCGYTRPVDILYRIVLYCICGRTTSPLKGSKMILRALARSALVTKTAALGAPRPNVTYHVYRHASALVGRKQRQNRQRHIAHAKRASRTLSELVVVARRCSSLSWLVVVARRRGSSSWLVACSVSSGGGPLILGPFPCARRNPRPSSRLPMLLTAGCSPVLHDLQVRFRN